MSSAPIGPSGGYRKMLSFGFTCLVYHATTRFCKRVFPWKEDPLGKTSGQMIGAARSARQNIVEASSRAGTSKETELRLLDVAKDNNRLWRGRRIPGAYGQAADRAARGLAGGGATATGLSSLRQADETPEGQDRAKRGKIILGLHGLSGLQGDPGSGNMKRRSTCDARHTGGLLSGARRAAPWRCVSHVIPERRVSSVECRYVPRS